MRLGENDRFFSSNNRVSTNLKEINFHDFACNLGNGTVSSFKKKIIFLVDINSSFNHLPAGFFLKLMAKRLSINSRKSFIFHVGKVHLKKTCYFKKVISINK